MSSSYWLDDIILPKKGKEVKPAEYAFSTDTVILNEVRAALVLSLKLSCRCTQALRENFEQLFRF